MGQCTGLDSRGLFAPEIAQHLGHAATSLTQDVYLGDSTTGIVKAGTALSSLPALNPTNTRSGQRKSPPRVEAPRGTVAPTGVDPVTSRFSVVRSTN